MDDIWSVDAWDRVRFCFPDNRNGSRIVITTRLSNLASDLTGSKGLVEMSLLDEANSWELLSKTVFGDCPLELEEIGKAIGLSCKGLPLSIVVVGGLLAKSKQTREFWEYIMGNLISTVNSEDDERCPNILYMSYKELPVYLKPCFLYMGVYPEDGVIRVSKLVKLWVAEGFLKPISGKSLEEIAKEYLTELSDRNLVLIHKVGSTGNIKQCKIHDLLRDLCLREAQKQRFYGVIRRPLEEMGNAAQRRIVIPISTSKNEAMIALSSMPLARSLMWYLHESLLPSLSLRLLRILDSRKIFHRHCLGMNLHQLVNSRFLTISDSSTEGFNFPAFTISDSSTEGFNFPASSVSRFWNLQTFMGMKFSIGDFSGPIDIWCMPLIRHVQFLDLHLPDPPDGHDGIVLENLQTLGRLRNFKCSEQVVKRIPNVKKLKIYKGPGLDDDVYSLSNLGRFHKLESLDCSFYPSRPASLPCLINFPDSLKKLALSISSSVSWEEILDKIGALPLLQKLKLENGSFREGQWKTTEGRFPNLVFLLLDGCSDLRVWIAESSHFPCLEHLHLCQLDKLEEIPVDFAEISTLRVIEVHRCGVSAVESAKRILDEQEELYGEEEAAVQVQVSMWRRNEAVERLASSNFHVRWLNK